MCIHVTIGHMTCLEITSLLKYAILQEAQKMWYLDIMADSKCLKGTVYTLSLWTIQIEQHLVTHHCINNRCAVTQHVIKVII